MTRNPDIDVYATIRPGAEISCEVTKTEVQFHFGSKADGFHLIIEAGALSQFVTHIHNAAAQYAQAA
ncbi:hypothetical protein JOD54_006394 [Actinokineospora baliensis]|uniref:hypothetical protein n=1 Tax=Actinokineospora baliensis TaxID=547056 RepID=UPI00195D2DF2|nr:hypothetical protein [Actinokineospora baliensis]MBM7776190.1 hypothetical protein [Actinokineospora baliensis]